MAQVKTNQTGKYLVKLRPGKYAVTRRRCDLPSG